MYSHFRVYQAGGDPCFIPTQGPFCLEFVRSHHAGVDFLLVLHLPPTEQKHTLSRQVRSFLWQWWSIITGHPLPACWMSTIWDSVEDLTFPSCKLRQIFNWRINVSRKVTFLSAPSQQYIKLYINDHQLSNKQLSLGAILDPTNLGIQHQKVLHMKHLHLYLWETQASWMFCQECIFSSTASFFPRPGMELRLTCSKNKFWFCQLVCGTMRTKCLRYFQNFIITAMTTGEEML